MLTNQYSQAPVRQTADISDAAATKDFPINVTNPESVPSGPPTDLQAHSDHHSQQGLQKLIESESQ